MKFKTLMAVALSAAILLPASMAQQAAAKNDAKPDVKNEAKAEAKTQASTPPTMPPSKGGDDFVIGAEDILNINVWREPEMSRTVPVRPDGKISLPLLGEFEASGSTAKQLEAKISKQLETILTNPQVTVIVQDIRSQKFSITGEINRPGSYSLSGSMTVLDAVALAGGLKDFARPKKMYVLRRGADGNSTKIAVNYKEVLAGNSNNNLVLQAKDTIVVP